MPAPGFQPSFHPDPPPCDGPAEHLDQHASSDRGELDLRSKLIRRQLTARLPETAKTEWLTRDQIKELLDTFNDELCPLYADAVVYATMAALVKLLNEDDAPTISYSHWARLSLGLESIIAAMARHPIPPLGRMHRGEFLRQNLVNLEKTCRYEWARQARAELVKIFTKKIEQITVNNPAQQDITLTKGSIKVGTPLPFLKGGLEFGYQTMRHVNDEGYVMQTRSGSVAVSAEASVHVGVELGVKGKGSGSTGPLAYCRTALDHAKYFFDDMLQEDLELPMLAPYLSRRAAADGRPAKKVEIAGFESLQNDFLIHQDRFAQYFSLILAARQEGKNQAPVVLRATAEKQARALIGTVSTRSGSLGGLLSFGFLQCEASGEKLTKTTSAKRSRTMCELVKDVNLRAPAKEELIGKLDTICNPIWQSLLFSFWGKDALDKGARNNAKIIANLQQDLKTYTRMHAWCAQGHPGAAASLASFHARYRAKNSADMLGNLALLIADSYAKVQQQERGARKDLLAAQVLELEHALYHCGIPKARQILEAKAFARQQFRYAQDEWNSQSSVGAGIFGAGHALPVKYSKWTLNHYESFAAGDYIKIDYTLGLSQEINREVLKSIEAYLQTNIPGADFFFAANGYSKQGNYSVRYFRPSAFGDQPYSKQYERIVSQETLQLGARVPLPVPLPVSIDVAGSYTKASTTMLSETPSSESLCYFARHFMHARQTNKTEASGKINQDSYWYRMERDYAQAFAKLFLNYAADRNRNGQLIKELDGIDTGLPIDAAGLVACRLARNRFLDCTGRYQTERSDENYAACLNELKAMLNTYFPFWLKRREHSPVYGKWHIPLLN